MTVGEHAFDGYTLAELECDGFSGIGTICRRCGHKALFALEQVPYRQGVTLARMRELIDCAWCRSRLENPERHHDLTFKPLRPNERWPSR
jgi:hypothetical protein